MTNENQKAWYESSTILASLSTVVISLFSITGRQIDPQLITDFAQQVALLATALTGLWAIRGRILASTKIG
ncbi:MAG: hypothetical protein V4691_04990 [Pseudomonadota bacterium]